MPGPDLEGLAKHNLKYKDRKPVVFNPLKQEEDKLPTIYCFLKIIEGQKGIAVAVSQDGYVLGTHACSSEQYVPHDLGVLERTRLDRHDISYKKHYPNGYKMAFIKNEEMKAHSGFQEAYQKNVKLTQALKK